MVVEHLVVGDREQPPPQVPVVLQARVRPQGGDHRLLEAVRSVVRAGLGQAEAVQVGAVGVEQLLERRQEGSRFTGRSTLVGAGDVRTLASRYGRRAGAGSARGTVRHALPGPRPHRRHAGPPARCRARCSTGRATTAARASRCWWTARSASSSTTSRSRRSTSRARSSVRSAPCSAPPRTARVVATEPTTVRSIGDPDALFFASHPELALELARQLAGRLHRLLAYLGDVRSQYRDAERPPRRCSTPCSGSWPPGRRWRSSPARTGRPTTEAPRPPTRRRTPRPPRPSTTTTRSTRRGRGTRGRGCCPAGSRC